ncbi:DUF3291 domain-containing protein [Actinokineospora sp.]|uniref:DUF3291 domain-containing protein n=1 Tax=Actinokineospora sp. TaxID=1872133 RepID=UPI0040376FB7
MWELAQVNVAIMRAPLTDPSMAEFAAAFDPVSRLADDTPGFVWRLRSTGGHAVITRDGCEQVVNLSVWRDYRSMHEFVYRSAHGRLLLHRDRWFRPTPQPSTALWWMRAGELPGIEHALARLSHLRRFGPSPQAFSLLRQFTQDGRPIRRGSRSGQ